MKSIGLGKLLAFFTVSVALVPLLFTVMLVSSRGFFLDPREPARMFARVLDEEWKSTGTLDKVHVERLARRTGFPAKAVAYVSSQGDVHFSTIPSIASGSTINLRDLFSYRNRESGRPSFNIVRIGHEESETPFLIYDFEPLAFRQSLLNRSLLLAGAVVLVLLLVAGGFSIAILRFFRSAVDALAADAKIVASGNLEHPVAIPSIREIRSLGESVNLMRLNLRDLLARQSRMLMGVSHDLKTPIALIQGYADALADGVAVDERSRERYIGIIREKSRQLEDLASELIDFLKVGRHDSGFSMLMEDLCVIGSSVGRRTMEDCRLVGRSFLWGFGQALATTPEFDSPIVPANRALVERALDNLIGNAFRYGGADCHVVLRLVKTRDRFIFSIEDDGPGIPEKDLPYIFDAFFRGSQSRSGEGHGLGLTLVAATAELHGWEAAVRRKDEGRGTIASLSVPVRMPAA